MHGNKHLSSTSMHKLADQFSTRLMVLIPEWLKVEDRAACGQAKSGSTPSFLSVRHYCSQGCNLGYKSLAVLIPNTQALWKRGFSLAEKLRDTKAEPVHDASVVEMRLSPFQSTSRPHAWCVYERSLRGEKYSNSHVRPTYSKRLSKPGSED